MALRFLKCVAVVTFVHILAAAVVFGAYFATKAGNGGAKGAGSEFVLVGTENQPPAVVVHEARAGETYQAVARAYGVTLEALLAANGRRPGQVLRAGERLVVPGHE